MSAASVIAAIAVVGVVLMLGFLVAFLREALLREGAPFACYWIVPVNTKTRRRAVEVLIVANHAAAYGTAERSNHFEEIFENENHDHGKFDSGFIAIGGNTFGRRSGWRSVQPRRNNVFREQRFWQ